MGQTASTAAAEAEDGLPLPQAATRPESENRAGVSPHPTLAIDQADSLAELSALEVLAAGPATAHDVTGVDAGRRASREGRTDRASSERHAATSISESQDGVAAQTAEQHSVLGSSPGGHARAAERRGPSRRGAKGRPQADASPGSPGAACVVAAGPERGLRDEDIDRLLAEAQRLGTQALRESTRVDRVLAGLPADGDEALDTARLTDTILGRYALGGAGEGAGVGPGPGQGSRGQPGKAPGKDGGADKGAPRRGAARAGPRRSTSAAVSPSPGARGSWAGMRAAVGREVSRSTGRGVGPPGGDRVAARGAGGTLSASPPPGALGGARWGGTLGPLSDGTGRAGPHRPWRVATSAADRRAQPSTDGRLRPSPSPPASPPPGLHTPPGRWPLASPQDWKARARRRSPGPDRGATLARGMALTAAAAPGTPPRATWPDAASPTSPAPTDAPLAPLAAPSAPRSPGRGTAPSPSPPPARRSGSDSASGSGAGPPPRGALAWADAVLGTPPHGGRHPGGYARHVRPPGTKAASQSTTSSASTEPVANGAAAVAQPPARSDRTPATPTPPLPSPGMRWAHRACARAPSKAAAGDSRPAPPSAPHRPLPANPSLSMAARPQGPPSSTGSRGRSRPAPRGSWDSRVGPPGDAEARAATARRLAAVRAAYSGGPPGVARTRSRSASRARTPDPWGGAGRGAREGRGGQGGRAQWGPPSPEAIAHLREELTRVLGRGPEGGQPAAHGHPGGAAVQDRRRLAEPAAGNDGAEGDAMFARLLDDARGEPDLLSSVPPLVDLERMAAPMQFDDGGEDEAKAERQAGVRARVGEGTGTAQGVAGTRGTPFGGRSRGGLRSAVRGYASGAGAVEGARAGARGAEGGTAATTPVMAGPEGAAAGAGAGGGPKWTPGVGEGKRRKDGAPAAGDGGGEGGRGRDGAAAVGLGGAGRDEARRSAAATALASAYPFKRLAPVAAPRPASVRRERVAERHAQETRELELFLEMERATGAGAGAG